MKKLGELLVEREWVSREQLTQALRHQQVFGGRIGTCLLELTLISEDRLTRALSDQLGVPPATVDDLRVIADGLIELVPAKLAWRTRAVPFERFGNALSVALVDTRDLQAQDELAFVTSRRLKVHVAPEVRVLEALEKHYNSPVEPRFARIWDRLNRAKYLWQDEPASGVRRRIAEVAPSPPAPAPIVASRDDEWKPAPPPPLDSAPPRPATPVVAAASVAAAPATPPPEAIAPAATSAAEPASPTAPQKRRWFFGSKTAPTQVPPELDEPPVAAVPVAPERSFVPVVTPPAPTPAPAPAAAPPPPAIGPMERPAAPRATPAAAPPSRPAPERASPRRPAATAAATPTTAPPASRGGARGSTKEVETLPPAPTPTPLAGREAPPAAAPARGAARSADRKPEPAVDGDADTTPMLVPKSAATLEDLEQRIAEVEERDDVAHAALSFLSRRFQRSLLFMIKGNHVAAWMGGGEGVDQRLFGEVAVGFDEPSAFLNLREGSQFYRGPLARLDAHQRLVRCWGGRYPKECLLLPVRIKKRLVAAIYLDRGSDDLGGTAMGELQQAASLLGRGLETFLIKRKQA
jgi:hypothetical protein